METEETQPAGAGYPSLDRQFLHDNYHSLGFGYILTNVLKVYCEQNVILMGQMREALDKGDFEEVAKIAHTIKGSSGSVGARAMEMLALNLEETAENGDQETIVRLVDELEQEKLRTGNAVQEMLRKPA